MTAHTCLRYPRPPRKSSVGQDIPRPEPLQRAFRDTPTWLGPMGKASRNHQGNARAKIATQRAAEQRRRRARRLWLAGGSTVAIVAIVAGLVEAKTMQTPAPSAPAVTQAAVVRQLAAVPASTLSSVGTGTATGLQRIQGDPP